MKDLLLETDDSKRGKPLNPRRFCGLAAAVIILLMILVSYHNSFTASWHFDDFPNIVENSNSHMKELSWDSIRRAMQGLAQGGMNRPVAYVSFALNYCVGGLDVFGYHLVNFIVHCLTALFLWLFIRKTLELPVLKGAYGRYANEIACLATLFWACNPIQVSAVTYIVQRMASMGGLFYIMAMYGYLQGRTSVTRSQSMAFYAMALVSALMAFGTKENTVTLPAAILLYDVLLIQGASRETFLKSLKVIAIPVAIAALYAAYRFPLDSLLDGYAVRPFTLTERLLTEPRVMIFYISLLVWPMSSRLTLLHDFEISQNILNPWTTLPAILAVVFLVGAGLYLGKKKPLLSFSIIFFFLNHLVEGSVVPLEILYVHRNYLPSLFFFVLPAAWLVHVLTAESASKNRRVLVAGLAGSLLLVSAANVYWQNEIYRDELTLWNDNVRKAPGLYRAHQNLSQALMKQGRHEEALGEMKEALKAPGVSYTIQKCATYNDLGELFAFRGDREAAKMNFLKAVELAPLYPGPYFGLTKLMLREGNLDGALEYSRKANELMPGNAEYRLLHSMVLLRRGNLDEAGKSAAAALAIRRDYLPAWVVLAEVERKRGDRERARTLFEAIMGEASSERAACEIVSNSFRYLYGREENISCKDGTARLLAYYSGKLNSP